MKSFFKKLAFVMALAMVVTLAAPAGTAALAAEFYISDEAGKKAETFKLEVGEKEDFAFKNAPDHKNYKWSWTSSDTTVATVNTSGLVEGKADGVATITVKGGDKYLATVEVTVGKGKVATNGAYTVKQTTATEIEVYFDGTPSFTKDDITLEFILDTEAGYKTKWPIESVTEIENGYKIKPYVDFSNGDTYLIKFGAEDEGTTFQTIFGAPDRIEVVYSSNGDEGRAYMSVINDTTTEYVPVVLDVKFFSGDVDVTSKYEKDKATSVMYDFALNTDVDNAFISTVTLEDKANGYKVGDPALFLTKAGVGAIVRATYTGVDANYEYYTLVDDTEIIYPEKMPEYTIKGVVNWTIVNKTHKSAEDIDWANPVQDIAALDDANFEDCKIVVLVVDSEGNYFVSDDRFVDPENKIYGSMAAANGAYGKFAQKNYSVQFSSSDTSKLLIGREGFLTTYISADVPVIVSLCNTTMVTTTNTNGFVKYVGALPVSVTNERAIKTVSPDSRTYSVLTDANDLTYTKGEIKISIKDQHGDAWWKNGEKVTVSTNVEGLVVVPTVYKTFNNKYTAEEAAAEGFVSLENQIKAYLAEDFAGEIDVVAGEADADGVVTETATIYKDAAKEEKLYTIDADGCLLDANANKVVVKAANTVSYNSKKGEAVITLDGVELFKLLPENRKTSTVNTIVLTFKAGKATTAATLYLKTPVKTDNVITVNRWQLTAGNIDQKVTEDEKIPAKNTIKLNEFNNSLAVGHKAGIELYNKDVAALENGYNTTNVTEGTFYLQVFDGSNQLVPVVSATGGLGVYEDASKPGVFHVRVADTTTAGKNNQIDYLATGNYTAKIVKAAYVDGADGNKVVIFNPMAANYTTTFKVENSNKHVEFVKVKTGKTITEEKTAAGIVVDALQFSLNGVTWEITTADIEKVVYKHNPTAGTKGGYIIIQEVVFKVPVDLGTNGDTTAKLGEDGKPVMGEDNKPVMVPAGEQNYYLDTVVVNKAIELKNGLTK